MVCALYQKVVAFSSGNWYNYFGLLYRKGCMVMYKHVDYYKTYGRIVIFLNEDKKYTVSGA